MKNGANLRRSMWGSPPVPSGPHPEPGSRSAASKDRIRAFSIESGSAEHYDARERTQQQSILQPPCFKLIGTRNGQALTNTAGNFFKAAPLTTGLKTLRKSNWPNRTALHQRLRPKTAFLDSPALHQPSSSSRTFYACIRPSQIRHQFWRTKARA